MRMRLALSVALLGFVTAAPVMARSLPDGGITSQELANILQEKGYKAQVTKDKDGDPMVRSASGGVDFLILYYECKGRQRCPSIQFYAGFKKKGITPAKYMAKHKWVSLDTLTRLPDKQLKDYLTRAHGIVAQGLSKKLRAQLGIATD